MHRFGRTVHTESESAKCIAPYINLHVLTSNTCVHFFAMTSARSRHPTGELPSYQG